jgi:membrane protease YdiL (CAAX protease family)
MGVLASAVILPAPPREIHRPARAVVPAYLLQVVALSVALTWLMGNTRGSLLLAVLMHSAINQTKDIVRSKVGGADNSWALSSSTAAWLTIAVLWMPRRTSRAACRPARASPPLP